MDDYKKIVDEKLCLREYLDDSQREEFYSVISEYLKNRSSMDALAKNLDELNDFFRKLNYDYISEITVIKNWSAIIHTDKNDLFYKYLVMARILNKDTFESIRDDELLNHGKDFMTSIRLLYARVRYLDAHPELVGGSFITRRKTLKITNEEFLNSYNISKDALLQLFPWNREALELVLSWEENSEILANLETVGVARSGGR